LGQVSKKYEDMVCPLAKSNFALLMIRCC
jgi:hypothetical protein